MQYFRPDYQRVRKGVGCGSSVHSAWRFLLKVIRAPCFLSLDSTLPDSGASLVKFTRGKCLWSIAGGNSSSCVMDGGRDLGIDPTISMFLYQLPLCVQLYICPLPFNICVASKFWVSCVLWRQFPPFCYGVLCFISHLPSSIFFHFPKTCWNIFSLSSFCPCVLTSFLFLYWHLDRVSGGKRHVLVVNLPWLIGRLRTWCSVLSSRFQSKCFS